MVIVPVGENLPLSATISDRETGLIVKATIEKMDGTILTVITLTEVHPADFLDFSFPMPSGVPFLKAKYAVYDSDGVTPNPNNGDFDEIYGPPVSGGSSYPFLVGYVQNQDQNIIGHIEECSA